MTPGEIPSDDLSALGLTDPGRARRMIVSLAGQGVTDDLVAELLPSLLDAVHESPDPDRALGNFVRWTEAVTSRYTHVRYLLAHPTALRIFFNVCGVSQLFSDILVRNPEYFEFLANPTVRSGGRSAAELYREVSSFVDCIGRPELKLEALRRFRQREILRIGARDILGLADMPVTAREFSYLADACVQKALEMSQEQLSAAGGSEKPLPLVVVAMGKLGGLELNYASDIDLLFICADHESEPTVARPTATIKATTKLAEMTVAALTREMPSGHVFRVDMRLRPEGRFGPLVRSLSSYGSYYESWAEPWEQQALIKARPIAGDRQLGSQFMRLAHGFVYRRHPSRDMLDAVRNNKQRIERKAEMEQQADINVKVGIGGIRDVEFTVQLLQLERGGRDPFVRTPTTLDALARLRQAGAIDAQTATELARDYEFLRNLEHRIQILYGRQTQSIPRINEDRRLLARRMGFATVDAFDDTYGDVTGRVHGHFRRLFYGSDAPTTCAITDDWPRLLGAVDTPAAKAEIERRLSDAGFRDTGRAYAHCRTAVLGGDYGLPHPDAPRYFGDLLPAMVDACARTGDPDAAFAGMESLAQASPNAAEFYRFAGQTDEVVSRLCTLGAGSRALVQSLARHMEWLDMLLGEDAVDPDPRPLDEMQQAMAARLRAPAPGSPAFWQAAASFVSRERLRIGARDIWGVVEPMTVCVELANMADCILGAVLRAAVHEAKARFASPACAASLDSLAIVGLGKLGGCELSYGSDLDVLFVCDGAATAGATDEDVLPAVTRAAEIVLACGQEFRTRGAPIEVDSRLRPEGRFGILVRSVQEYQSYYDRTAETWERQTLIKARHCAGNTATGIQFLDIARAVVFDRSLQDDQVEGVRRMKRRIEAERLKPSERWTDVKLGHGGLSDIEFATQLAQMVHGAIPSVRRANTVDALHGLAASGVLAAPDTTRLADHYITLTAIRNRLALLAGQTVDILPRDPNRLRALAIEMGTAATHETDAGTLFMNHVSDRMRDARSVVERLFYGGTTP